jgi:hypothetical protein
MAIKFSLKTQAFYDEKTSVIPGDAEEITHDQHMALIYGMNDGERRVYRNSVGELILSDRKPSQWHTWNGDKNTWDISDDSRVQVTESEKSRRIQEANDFINSQQWPGRAVMDRLSDAEKQRYNTWLDYLDALAEIDTSAAQIEYPSVPA